MKLVKVARVGEKIQQVAIPDTGNVRSALIAAGRLPFIDEDIWLNHQIAPIDAEVFDGGIIILEPRLVPPAIRAFIDKLIEHDMLDEMDYVDEDGNIDYSKVTRYEKEMINDLIETVRNYYK